jgi:tRNA (guanine37-N1)-methyltransferase
LGRTLLVDVVGLFPELVTQGLGVSVLGRAQQRSLLAVRAVQLRDYALGRHLSLDDEPYGGGAGMLLRPDPVLRAIRALRRPRSLVVLLSADGARFDQARARELAACDHLILLCGHYEGFDARIRHFVDLTLSLGDFVLSGGEPAALAIVDAVARLREGVIDAASLVEESFNQGLLEAPQYTRPPVFQGIAVPGVLLSGHHARIRLHREAVAVRRTAHLRPRDGNEISAKTTRKED